MLSLWICSSNRSSRVWSSKPLISVTPHSSKRAWNAVVVGTNTDEPLNYYYVVYGERKDINKLVVEFEIEENDDEEESIAESPNVVDTDSVEYINP